jgi:hypothetical protein
MYDAVPLIDPGKWRKSYAKQRWYAKKIKNACGVIDTACKIDERFEQP